MKKTWFQNMRKSRAIDRTNRDGIVFDSKLEMRRFEQLKLEQRAGEIRNLRRQIVFPLEIDGKPIMSGSRRAKFTADFVYERKFTGLREVELIKRADGIPNPEYVHKEEWREVIEDVKSCDRKTGKVIYSRDVKLRIGMFEAMTGKKVTIITWRNKRWVRA